MHACMQITLFSSLADARAFTLFSYSVCMLLSLPPPTGSRQPFKRTSPQVPAPCPYPSRIPNQNAPPLPIIFGSAPVVPLRLLTHMHNPMIRVPAIRVQLALCSQVRYYLLKQVSTISEERVGGGGFRLHKCNTYKYDARIHQCCNVEWGQKKIPEGDGHRGGKSRCLMHTAHNISAIYLFLHPTGFHGIHMRVLMPSLSPAVKMIILQWISLRFSIQLTEYSVQIP